MALPEDRLAWLELAVERGRLAFEDGHYLDAAAFWEGGWHAERGPPRRLLQGLIQAAGAYDKRRQRRPAGMVKLLSLSLEQLGPLPDGFGGLRLDAFRNGLKRSLMEAYTWSAGGPLPGPAPSLGRSP